MIDQQSAQNSAFKTRVFLFVWVVITSLAWLGLDNFVDQNLVKELHIFLQAWLASLSPVQLFGHKPLVTIDDQSYKAAELAAAMLDRENVQKMINYFFIYTPMLTLAVTSSIFYFSKSKKTEKQEVNLQLNKWNGN
ncbi:MAG: hypothetical protein HOP21_10675 [Methylotenera sp.]|nr:hypothetical protein [Methylotenera sp.]